MSRETVAEAMEAAAARSAPPRLLLVPSFTELEWGIKPSLEGWADVATFDAPGIGDTEIPFEVELDPGRDQSAAPLPSTGPADCTGASIPANPGEPWAAGRRHLLLPDQSRSAGE